MKEKEREWVVFGKLTENKKQYKVQCPWCHEEHTHGATPGHRWAHCANQKEVTRGYTIVPEEDK